MVTNPTQMALGIAAIVVLWALFIVFLGPKVTPYSRKQWALLMTTLIILATPISCYIIFVVGPSKGIDPRHVARVGALNLLICVPLFILIGRRILKIKK